MDDIGLKATIDEPREALDDPTRREDLFALLRTVRDQERRTGGLPGSQSAARTAELLGLDLDELG